MDLDDNAIASYLSRHYPGRVAARALWQWAGGQDDGIPFQDGENDLWPPLLALAQSNEDPAPDALLRQALLDHPSDTELLAFCDAVAKDAVPQPELSAKMAVNRLREVDDQAPGALWCVLCTLPDIRADALVSFLAPAMAREMSNAERQRLEPMANEVIAGPAPGLPAVAQGLDRLLLSMPQWTDTHRVDGHADIVGAFRKVLGPLAATDAVDSDSAESKTANERVAELAGQLKEAAATADDPVYALAVDGVCRLADALCQMLAGNDAPDQIPAAEALRDAIRGNLPPVPEATEETT